MDPGFTVAIVALVVIVVSVLVIGGVSRALRDWRERVKRRIGD